eukprot:16185540-Heterocapsa_arctica.AAC.1
MARWAAECVANPQQRQVCRNLQQELAAAAPDSSASEGDLQQRQGQLAATARSELVDFAKMEGLET